MLFEMMVKGASEVDGCDEDCCADGSRSVSESFVDVIVSLIDDCCHLSAA